MFFLALPQMKRLTGKYLFLPLIVLFCGLYIPHSTADNVIGFSGQSSHYSKSKQHHSGERPVQEIVEHAPDSFQKDLAGDAVFSLFRFNDLTNSYLELLSKRLSVQKPFLITHFSEALYLLIRILRL